MEDRVTLERGLRARLGEYQRMMGTGARLTDRQMQHYQQLCNALDWICGMLTCTHADSHPGDTFCTNCGTRLPVA